MKNITTIQAKVTRIGQLRPSKFASEGRPDRAPVDFETPEGNKISEWLDQPIIQRLQVGASVTLVHDGRGYSVADVAPAPSAAIAQTCDATVFKTPTKAEREDMMNYIDFEANLYKYCFDEAQKVMQQVNLKDEVLKDVATTLFLGVVRKYRLQ